jgi:hypothetical protein
MAAADADDDEGRQDERGDQLWSHGADTSAYDHERSTGAHWRAWLVPVNQRNSISRYTGSSSCKSSTSGSLLSVMRDDDCDPASRFPVPGLDNVHALVQRVTDAGQPVTLRVEGQPCALPQTVKLSVYRVVQEALTNVVRHAAPATATVVIRYDDSGGVVVEVADDGHRTANNCADGYGHGLAGMRERVCLLGGELSAGPRAGGGYQVVARIPAEAGAL